MPKLLLKHEGMILNTYELKEGKTTIGRKSDNDIQLNDAVASSHHACIVLKPNEYLEEHLGFTNLTSLIIVGSILLVSILASILFPPKQAVDLSE